jgi:hypothetical protein
MAVSQNLSFLLDLVRGSAQSLDIFFFIYHEHTPWFNWYLRTIACELLNGRISSKLLFLLLPLTLIMVFFLGGIWSPSTQVWRMGRQRPSICWWIHSHLQQSQRWEKGWEWTRYRIPLQRRQDWEGGVLCHQGEFSMCLHDSISYCVMGIHRIVLSLMTVSLISLLHAQKKWFCCVTPSPTQSWSVTQRNGCEKYGPLILLYTYYP